MANYNVTIKEKNGSEYDIIYPKCLPIRQYHIMKSIIVVHATSGSTVKIDGHTIQENFGQWSKEVGYGKHTIAATSPSGIVADTVTTNVEEVRQYDVNIEYDKVYGAQWDVTSTTKWVRTGDAAGFADPVPYVAGATTYGSPFDNIYPWSGMVIVNDANAGEVVAIPKFYYKWTSSNSLLKLEISEKKLSGFYTSPAHADRGDGKGERDIVYIGRYKCSSTNYDSRFGIAPMNTKNIATFRSGIHALGDTIWQNDYAMWMTIRMLYLVEFADWNSQARIGQGGATDTPIVTGYTKSMPYHTGTTKSNRDESGVGTQYRHIEGLWDEYAEFVDGITFDGVKTYCAMNPADFGTNKTRVISRYPDSGYIQYYSYLGTPPTGYEWFNRAITASFATSSTYVTDYYSYSSSGTILVANYPVGGPKCGMFNQYTNLSASGTSNRISSRLMILP